jgi:hemolysin activation/secretion protein
LRSIQCFRPRTITFVQNKLLTSAEEKSLSEQYLNKCLTLDWLTKFDEEVAKILADKGYVTSRSTSSQQSLIDGNMKVQIIEGHIEKIIINDDGFFDKMQIKTAFGFDDLPRGGKVLNIHDLEPALERINRLSSNKAKVKVIQGSSPNKSIIIIENHPKNTARVNLSYDNIGSKNTGVRRDTIAFAQDNLLKMNDIFNLSRTSNDLDLENDRRYNNATNGSWSVPFGQHNLTMSGGRNSYFFLTGSSGTTRAKGFSVTKSAALESLLFRNKKYKISSNILFTNRENQIFTDEVRNETQSRKSSIATASISNTFFLDSATLFLKPSFSKSLNVLNAKTDGANVSKFTPHAEVEIFKFYANYAKKFVIPNLEIPASYNFTFDSQLAKDHLYSIDQFSSGGFYSVRGFRQGSISGDSGFNIRNEVTLNLGQLILPHINAEKKSPNLSQLNNFSLTPFYDYGHVQNRGFSNGGRLSSSGFKIAFSKNDINASMTFAHVISRSRMLTQNHREENTIYFDLGTQLSFF